MNVKKRSLSIFLCLFIINSCFISFLKPVKAEDCMLVDVKVNNNDLSLSLVNDSNFSFAGKTFNFPSIYGMMTNETPIEVTEGNTITITITIPYSVEAATYRATVAFDTNQFSYVKTEIIGDNDDFYGRVKVGEAGVAIN